MSILRSQVLLFVLGSVVCTGTYAAKAVIRASPSVIYVWPDQPNKNIDIKVSNRGLKTWYLKAILHDKKVVKVDHQFQTHSKPVKNFREAGVIYSPNKLALKANRQRNIRIKILKFPKKRVKTFVMHFSPYIPKSLSGALDNGRKAARVASIPMPATVIRVMPSTINLNVNLKRDGNTLTVINTGDLGAHLLRGKQCLGDSCVQLKDLSLAPGRTLTTQLPYDAPAEYTLSLRIAGKQQYDRPIHSDPRN